jgi:hypothetical protein
MMLRACLAAVLAAILATPLQAQPQRSWTETKCARYAEAWTQALERFGRQGLGETFLGRHEAFLASGCRARPAVCPRSLQELDIANAMTIAAMNAGAASTFPPFLCREGDDAG